ncbi:DUF4765 family protein [Lentzea sp. NPDC051208]|uniref:DUF4765 family protein n=1 Tax=Lentzea sp. NPDC051208 TaxID=3154642 RepID=UPI0034305AB5
MTTPTPEPATEEPTTPDVPTPTTVAERAILRTVHEIATANPALARRLTPLARSSLVAGSVSSVSSARMDALRAAPATARSTRPSLGGAARLEMLRGGAEDRAVAVGVSPADVAGYLGGHSLSPEGRVKMAKPDDDVVLARGVNERQLQHCLTHSSSPDTVAPTEREARAQVGEYVFGDLVEFTTNPAVAVRFSTRSASEKKYVIVVRIKRKYLAKGSVSEGGWICRNDAPYEVLSSVLGRLLV